MFLPVDHGYFQGPTRNLERPGETIAPLMPYADALFATRGVVRAVVDPADTKPLILRVSGGTSMAAGDLADEGVTTSMEDAVRLNVAAVGISRCSSAPTTRSSPSSTWARLVDEGEKLRHPGDGGHRRGPGAGPARFPLPGHGLPHLRRDGRQGGQDLLVRRRLRPCGKRLPGAGGDGRRPPSRHGAGGAWSSCTTGYGTAPSA